MKRVHRKSHIDKLEPYDFVYKLQWANSGMKMRIHSMIFCILFVVVNVEFVNMVLYKVFIS